jgi:hypothetical protein
MITSYMLNFDPTITPLGTTWSGRCLMRPPDFWNFWMALEMSVVEIVFFLFVFIVPPCLTMKALGVATTPWQLF